MERELFHDIIIGLFLLSLVANTIALVRHWRALKEFTAMMTAIGANQQLFNDNAEMILQNRQRLAERGGELLKKQNGNSGPSIIPE